MMRIRKTSRAWYFINSSGRTVHVLASPEHQAWHRARDRCFNPKDPRYPTYGGRGITMCDGFSDFDNFIAILGRRPGRKGTPLHRAKWMIDRIDNDMHYSCGRCAQCCARGWTLNVQWALKSEVGGKTTRSKQYEERL